MHQETTSALERLLRHPKVDRYPPLTQIAIEKAIFLNLIRQHFSETDYNKIVGLFDEAGTMHDTGFGPLVTSCMSAMKKEMGENAMLVDYKALYFILAKQEVIYCLESEDADLQQALLAVIHPQPPQIYKTDPPNAYALYRQHLLAASPQPTA